MDQILRKNEIHGYHLVVFKPYLVRNNEYVNIKDDVCVRSVAEEDSWICEVVVEGIQVHCEASNSSRAVFFQFDLALSSLLGQVR